MALLLTLRSAPTDTAPRQLNYVEAIIPDWRDRVDIGDPADDEFGTVLFCIRASLEAVTHVSVLKSLKAGKYETAVVGTQMDAWLPAYAANHGLAASAANTVLPEASIVYFDRRIMGFVLEVRGGFPRPACRVPRPLLPPPSVPRPASYHPLPTTPTRTGGPTRSSTGTRPSSGRRFPRGCTAAASKSPSQIAKGPAAVCQSTPIFCSRAG